MRLNKTKDLGAEFINFDNEDPVERIKKETGGKGAICIDAIGYEAVGHSDGGSDSRGSTSARCIP
jgi:S-(hydroxymethyl)glutathione dehydrogenase / alcohol dehydrogenase